MGGGAGGAGVCPPHSWGGGAGGAGGAWHNRAELRPALTAVILAAGLGTRMRSRIPKVLHPICGRPMIDWVLEAVNEAGVSHVTVVANPHHTDVAAHLSPSETQGEGQAHAPSPPRGEGQAPTPSPP